ncbi:MAG TPA: hypothetical protein VMH23_15340 [Bacteroidota bacterium]|nr:hypothetical protein [Bacteroidota bacterium]
MKRATHLLLALPLFSMCLLQHDPTIPLSRQEAGSDPFKNGFASAEIRLHNGAPTLFLDGKPLFYGTWWVSPPTQEGWAAFDIAKKNAAESGIHIYAFDVGSTEWAGPAPGRSGHYDFSTVRARFNRILEADPKALFHLRIYLEMSEPQSQWWHDLYPEEREVVSDGTPYRQSFASTVWREQAKDFLRAYIAYLKQIGLFNRVVSYQVGAGHTGEWVKGKLSMFFLTGDYSKPMKRHFREWLRGRYNNDESALKHAWNQPQVSFESAEVPSDIEQFQAKNNTFRDTRQEQNVIDYYRCLADLCGSLVVDFCHTVKEATGGKALAGAFFGYLMELAWNAGFFAEGPGSPYSTYQRSGHLGLGRVLESPDVDFLVSPYSYGFRGMGGEGCSMLPTESLRLHKKIYLMEDDTRTHTDNDPAYGRARNLDESRAILRRNFGYVATHGQGMWWLVNKGAIETNLEPAFSPMLKEFAELGKFALETDRSPGAEIAVLLDDESFFYETVRNDLDVPLVFHQRLIGLPRSGAPYDVYLLNDFLKGRLRPYKLYIFLNAFRLDNARRDALKKELRRDGRTALWIYAPGYINDTASVEQMRDITGFTFIENNHPWPSFLHITNFNHPITAHLSQDLFWGTDSHLGPLFHVADASAEVLGEVIMAQGTCQPGFAIRSFPTWTSIYVAVPNIPAQVLREIARYAKVHIYSEEGDVLDVSHNLLSVHTLSGGKRIFSLPSKAEVVYDLFQRRMVATAADRFEVTLPPASTSLYFFGSKSIIRQLGR